MDELDQLSKEIAVLVDRLHHEYNKFFSGAEKKPPIQLRALLEKQVERAKILQRQSQNQSVSFRAQNTMAKYNTHRILWDKRLAEREKTNS